MPNDESIRCGLKCRIYPVNTLGKYKYVVVFARFDNKWIFSRHSARATWESQGGHIENGETPIMAAKRELFEESGATNAYLYPVCDYLGYNDFSSSNGQVFLAIADKMGDLPESEIAEICLAEDLPVKLTYPMTTPVLFEEVKRVFVQLKTEDKRT